MLKILMTLSDLYKSKNNNMTQTAKALSANRSVVFKAYHKHEDAFIIMEDGSIYKRTDKVYVPEAVVTKYPKVVVKLEADSAFPPHIFVMGALKRAGVSEVQRELLREEINSVTGEDEHLEILAHWVTLE